MIKEERGGVCGHLAPGLLSQYLFSRYPVQQVQPVELGRLFFGQVHSGSDEVDHILSPYASEGIEETVHCPTWLLPPLEEEEASGVRGAALQELNVLVQSQLAGQVPPVLQ